MRRRWLAAIKIVFPLHKPVDCSSSALLSPDKSGDQTAEPDKNIPRETPTEVLFPTQNTFLCKQNPNGKATGDPVEVHWELGGCSRA